MNKHLCTLLLTTAILCVASTNTASAQGKAGESVISANVGWSLMGSLIRSTVSDATTTDDTLGLDYTFNGSPAVVIGYDIGISEWFSMGALFSTQAWNGTLDHAFDNNKNIVQVDHVEFALRRTNISFAPKFHFISKERSDLYSGLRIGMTFWNPDIKSEDPNFNTLSKFTPSLPVPSAAIALLGGRTYITDHVGVNFELSVGAPYVLTVGLNGRF